MHGRMMLSICCCVFVLLLSGCKEAPDLLLTEYRAYEEGPHIVVNGNSAYAFYFTQGEESWTLRKEELDLTKQPEVIVQNPVFDPFTVELDPDPEIVPTNYPEPSKVTVISDIEGNFSALYSLLVAQDVIDRNGNWIYGDGHLVMLGDLFDRGPDVTPTFWLLYKLESEARKAGGYVHTLLGNHEIMIFGGDTRYINSKYKAQSNDTGMSYSYLYSTNTILGEWLRGKPAIIKLGDILLSHAGISPDVLNLQLDLDEINDLVRERNLYQVTEMATPANETIFGTTGIFWYRGWVDDPPSVNVLEAILDKYDAGHVVIGHTIVPDIQASFDYRLVMADLRQPRDVNQAPVRALGIEGNSFYEINSRGERRLIESS